MSDQIVENGAPQPEVARQELKQAQPEAAQTLPQPPPSVTLDVKPAQAKETVQEEAFSWLNPHPIFVIIFVGPEKKPFGIQKDFLCHRSSFYRDYFAMSGRAETVEHTVELPEASPEIFGLVQHFMYTGRLSPDSDDTQPSYETLVSLWKLGNKLGIEGLCDQTLDAMITCRRKTGRIPSTPLIVQVWKDTPEGSAIRTLLLTWAAEYLDSSGEAAENFAKSLPQEVLSELIMTVVSLKTAPKPQPAPAPTTQPAAATDLRKNVHYLDAPSDDDGVNGSRKHRRVSGAQGSMAPPPTKGPRTMVLKPQKRRTSTAYIDPASITTAQKLDFCADLLTRMLSGPGFWTRLVGPFRDPVDPKAESVPDYLDKVKRPMDLSTIKGRMDRGEYADEEAFLKDMRQIFENCFTYWKKGTAMHASGERLQKTFEEKFAGMNKWIAKMGGEEGE
ncbi:bromodomain-containing protein [Sarocladium implicatum]|nr:bromodomain-containing protein [Sarocladium implicatum]